MFQSIKPKIEKMRVNLFHKFLLSLYMGGAVKGAARFLL